MVWALYTGSALVGIGAASKYILVDFGGMGAGGPHFLKKKDSFIVKVN